MRVAIAAALAALVALPAAAVTRERWGERRKTPAFELAPGGSGGGTSNANVNGFCSQFASEMTGNYFCKDGSGNTGIQLSAVGSPATQTDAMCPNGPNCNAITGIRTGTGKYFSTANMASPPGDFSSCALFVFDDITINNSLVSKWGTNSSFLLEGTASTLSFGVHNGISQTVVFAGSPLPGVLHIACGTYDFVTSGTSVERLYLDGVEVGNNTAALGPAIAMAGIPIGVGHRGDGTSPLGGRIYAALLTEKVLSPATISTMASALLPTVQGTRGETLTVSRASVRSCCKSDGTACSILPANKACVHDGMLDVSGDVNQLAVRSSEFDNASWPKTAATVTANSTTAPDGTLTADTIVASGLTGRVEQSVAAVAGTSVTGSVWVRSVSGTQAGLLKVYNYTAGSDTCSLAFTATTTWQRLSCTGTITSGNTVGPVVYATDTIGSFGSVVVWGAQLNTGSTALPYCPSAATATTCLRDQVSYSLAATSFSVPGCVRACVTLTNTSDGIEAVGTVGSTNRDLLYKNISDNNIYFYDGTAASAATPPGGWVAGKRECFVAEWGGGVKQVFHLPEMSSGGSTALNSPATTITGGIVGIGSGVASFLADSIQWGNSKEGCR